MTARRRSIRVENVVATAETDRELDLERLAFDLPRTDYDCERFPGLVYRPRNPEASVLIFRSGKIVITGARSVAGARSVLADLLGKLDVLGIDVPEDLTPTVQNVLSSVRLGERLDLNAIAIELGLENVEYDPTRFPGLVYRFEKMDVVALLFTSGKAVITGTVRREEASRALTRLRSRLEGLGPSG